MNNRDFFFRAILSTACALLLLGLAPYALSFANSDPDKDVRVATIGVGNALVGGGFAALIAALGFWITYQTSTKANREVAASARSAALDQIAFASTAKIAEFRADWIEKLRTALSELTSAFVAHEASNRQDNLAWERFINRKSYIFLLLNHSEASHFDLYERIKALNPKLLDKIPTLEARDELFTKLQDAASKVLKVEWDRLKTELKTLEGKT